MKLVLHRDRDFMVPVEVEAFCKDYDEKGIRVWLTKAADIEGAIRRLLQRISASR